MIGMLRELLKPRSYDGVRLIKQGQIPQGLFQITTATALRTGLAFTGIFLAGFGKKDALLAAFAGNLAITAGVVGYYAMED